MPIFETIEMGTAVVLKEDKEGLRRGQVGTVVSMRPDLFDLYTVEFADQQGEVFANTELTDDQFIQMRWDSVKRCAACGAVLRRRYN